jgi:hypothetical protein
LLSWVADPEKKGWLSGKSETCRASAWQSQYTRMFRLKQIRAALEVLPRIRVAEPKQKVRHSIEFFFAFRGDHSHIPIVN